jgi:hypothetical protein
MHAALLFLALAAPPQAPTPPQAPLVRVAPAPKPEPCPCSTACTCGCVEGLPCRCGNTSAPRSAPTAHHPATLMHERPRLYAPERVYYSAPTAQPWHASPAPVTTFARRSGVLGGGAGGAVRCVGGG